MSLIFCIECNKEISDKSETCPYCGCPTKESIEHQENDTLQCIINGKPYDLSNIKKMLDDAAEEEDAGEAEEIENAAFYEIGELIPDIEWKYEKELFNHLQKNTLPRVFNCPTIPATPVNVPRCPTCSSTNIKRLSGLFDSSIYSRLTFKCNSCGYRW